MTVKPMSQEEYKSAFAGARRSKALFHAMDIRKFEIELYWKRATYFWTFIAADLGGLGLVLTSKPTKVGADISVLLCCLGIVLSVGWVLANRGSKHWQENWENHVDMLEDPEHGPLYKTILTRPKPVGVTEWIDHFLTGPSQYSVSKINQIISLYVALLWIGLLVYCTPIDPDLAFEPLYLGAIFMSALTCVCFFVTGRTHKDDYWHRATKRASLIQATTTRQTPSE